MGAEMTRIEIDVAGMTCGGCENSVRGALGRLDGVTEVHADHRTGRVVVEASSPIDPGEVKAAVEDAGYDVVPPGRRDLPLA